MISMTGVTPTIHTELLIKWYKLPKPYSAQSYIVIMWPSALDQSLAYILNDAALFIRQELSVFLVLEGVVSISCWLC